MLISIFISILNMYRTSELITVRSQYTRAHFFYNNNTNNYFQGAKFKCYYVEHLTTCSVQNVTMVKYCSLVIVYKIN